eukprot:SAG31_NODE_22392_length_526_cov_1.779859_2_plen_71_part_01
MTSAPCDCWDSPPITKLVAFTLHRADCPLADPARPTGYAAVAPACVTVLVPVKLPEASCSVSTPSTVGSGL